MNRKTAVPARILALLALILTLTLCGSALADSYDANTMRLLRYQGDIEIYDPSGMPRFVLESVRESVAVFMGNAPQFDDLTMLCVTYHGGHDPLESSQRM